MEKNYWIWIHKKWFRIHSPVGHSSGTYLTFQCLRKQRGYISSPSHAPLRSVGQLHRLHLQQPQLSVGFCWFWCRILRTLQYLPHSSYSGIQKISFSTSESGHKKQNLLGGGMMHTHIRKPRQNPRFQKPHRRSARFQAVLGSCK